MKKVRVWFRALPLHKRGEALLLAGFFLSFALGQLGRIYLTPSLSFYVHDILIGLWLLSHLQWMVFAFKKLLGWLKLHPLLVASILWIGIGLLWGIFSHPELRPLLILLRLVSYTFFSASVADLFDKNRVLLRGLLVISANLMLWLALLQYLFIPDTRFLSILGWDDHYFRLIGPLFDPNFTGMFIVLTIVYTASIHLLLPKKVQIVLQSYYAALLAVTYSRASYATAGLAALLLAAIPLPLKYWKVGQRLALGAVAFVVFSIVLFCAPKPGGEGVRLLRTASIEARQTSAYSTFQHLSAFELIVGRGLFSSSSSTPSASAIPNHAQVPDNIILLLLSGTGIVGTILLVSSVLYWIGVLSTKEAALAIALGVTLLHAQFNNTFFEPFISLYLLLALFAPLEKERFQFTPNKRFRGKKKKIKYPKRQS
ncbi:hypothetical protein KA012_00820 [Candidatus Woesebacteria bacterium]|nr:hypothetical protein [Candidatus Woesebacteria bacterium]